MNRIRHIFSSLQRTHSQVTAYWLLAATRPFVVRSRTSPVRCRRIHTPSLPFRLKPASARSVSFPVVIKFNRPGRTA